MPAETHQHTEQVTATHILDLLAEALEEDTVDPRARVEDLGLADETQILALWDMAIEEYGERSVGEPDLDELLESTTAASLAQQIADAITGCG